VGVLRRLRPVAVFDTLTERLDQGTIGLRASEAFHCSVLRDLHLAPGTYRLEAAQYRYDRQREYGRWFPTATLFSTDQDACRIADLYSRVVAFELGTAPVAPESPGTGLV
jgi:hypothetical protein